MDSNDRMIVRLVMAAHAMVHTYELSIPILVPIWLSEFSIIDLGIARLPVNEATLGGLVAVGYGLFGLGALPSGVLVDRLDARLLITGCLVGMGGSFLVLSMSPSPVVVGLALGLWGIAASVYHPSGLALISRGVTQRGSAFAYHGMAGNVGIALGPLATTLMLVFLDWRLVVGLLTIPVAATALFAVRVDIDERAAVVAGNGGTGTTASDQDNGTVTSLAEFVSTSRTLFTSAFALVFAVTLFSGLYYRGVLTFLPELLRGVPSLVAVELGGRTYQPGDYVYVGLLMVGVSGQYVAGKLTDRYRPEYGLVFGFGALAVVALLYLPAVSLGLAPLLALSALLGFFLFFVQPFYQATVAEYTPPGTRGMSYGFTYLGVFGIGAFGAVLAGTMLAYFSAEQLFVMLAVLAMSGSSIAGFLLWRTSQSAPH